MSNSTEHPKVFISYSWTSPEHEQFVLDLATTLRDNGVDAILDKWRLKPGQDKFVFMESMVTDPAVAKVLVLSDKRYAQKADARSGGVGTESQIISAELYSKTTQTKFIPVVCEFEESGEPCLPVFMKGRIHVDMSGEDKFGEGLEQLLRLVYDQPTHKEPALGASPAFLKAEATGLVLTRELAAAVRAIQEAKTNRAGLATLFLRAFVARVNELYGEPTGDDYDEPIFQAIQRTRGLRDQLSEYLEALAAFSEDAPAWIASVLSLLEDLGARFKHPRDGVVYPGWQDLHKFVALEAMLLTVAALLRHRRWLTLRRLLNYRYVLPQDGEMAALTTTAFESRLCSLDEHRNARLKLNRLAVSADLLRERCSEVHTPFSELRQADVFLALDAAVNMEQRGEKFGQYRGVWVPRTAVFMESRPTELFMRLQDPEVRKGIYLALGVDGAAELARRIEHASGRLQDFRLLSLDRFGRDHFKAAINLQELVDE